MAAPGEALMSDSDETKSLLSDLFGSYKAEWLRGRIFDLFAEPSYFPELQTHRPCVLVGGRGTGKTTVLRCLSYEGQLALKGGDPTSISSWLYFGFYYRVNTNRVTAFKGPEVSSEEWRKIFAHYLNLEFCELVLRFLLWHSVRQPSSQQLSAEDCKAVAISLNINPAETVGDLATGLSSSRLRFEAYLNNIKDEEKLGLSLQGAPIDALMERVSRLPQFTGKNFFFLIDEYENLLDDQQQVVNTLIKHAANSYTFKVGVRELGWRQRSTINTNETLNSPADYVRIDIADKLRPWFTDFATKVCNDRLRLIPGAENLTVDTVLETLSDEEEAKRLGVDDHLTAARSDLDPSSPERIFFDTLSPLEAYFVIYWARTHDSEFVDLSAAIRDWMQHPKEWVTRFENYKFAIVFTLKKGKRGVRKYYAGWSVFTQLAATNIRYLLELLEQSLLRSPCGRQTNPDTSVGRNSDSSGSSRRKEESQRIGGGVCSGRQTHKTSLGLRASLPGNGGRARSPRARSKPILLARRERFGGPGGYCRNASQSRSHASRSSKIPGEQVAGRIRYATVRLRDAPNLRSFFRVQLPKEA